MRGRPRFASRAEDLEFMAATGETHVGAARRLGMRVDSLQAWCDDNARDTWARLVANAHAPPDPVHAAAASRS